MTEKRRIEIDNIIRDCIAEFKESNNKTDND